MPGGKTETPQFEYSARLTEFSRLGILGSSPEAGTEVEWEGPNMKVTNLRELNRGLNAVPDGLGCLIEQHAIAITITITITVTKHEYDYEQDQEGAHLAADFTNIVLERKQVGADMHPVREAPGNLEPGDVRSLK